MTPIGAGPHARSVLAVGLCWECVWFFWLSRSIREEQVPWACLTRICVCNSMASEGVNAHARNPFGRRPP